MTAIIYIGVLFLLILLCTIVLNIYRRHKNQELIETVTSLSRGTNSELSLILKLLKSGVNSKTIFHRRHCEGGRSRHAAAKCSQGTTKMPDGVRPAADEQGKTKVTWRRSIAGGSPRP